MLKVIGLLAVVMPVAPAGSLHPPVTVVLDFHGPHSARSISVMEHEAAALLKSRGYRFDWKLHNELSPQAEFTDVLVLDMKGTCGPAPVIVPFDERGPLGMTSVIDGEVISFGAVECDRVRGAVSRARDRHTGENSDAVLGRALGRVAAHELYHMLSHKTKHASTGVARARLSADELTANQFRFDEPASAAVKSSRQR